MPSSEEIKRDRVLQIKMMYVDAISRVFYHLRDALDVPNFLTERISQRLRALRGGQVDSGADLADETLNLEELFKNVLEDDRN